MPRTACLLFAEEKKRKTFILWVVVVVVIVVLKVLKTGESLAPPGVFSRELSTPCTLESGAVAWTSFPPVIL